MKYYDTYEVRHRVLLSAGVTDKNPQERDRMFKTLVSWVEANKLQRKSVVEFACGNGEAGAILSRLGVQYTGFDLSPTAVKLAASRLKEFPSASVSVLDMAKEHLAGKYDAALDIMGFHMLVTDDDRKSYLNNAYTCLRSGAPMLFMQAACCESSDSQTIESIEQWEDLQGEYYGISEKQKINGYEVYLPKIPTRPKSMSAYISELEHAGFQIETVEHLKNQRAGASAINIYVKKRENI